MKYPRADQFVDIDPAITIRDYSYLIDTENPFFIPDTAMYNKFARLVKECLFPTMCNCMLYIEENNRIPKKLHLMNYSALYQTLNIVTEAAIESAITVLHKVAYFEPVTKARTYYDNSAIGGNRLIDYNWMLSTPSGDRCIIQLVPVVERALTRSVADWMRQLVSGKVAATAGVNLHYKQRMEMVLRVWNTPLSYTPLRLCSIQLSDRMEFPAEVLQRVIDLTHENTRYKRVSEFNAHEKECYDRRRDVFPESGSSDRR